MKKYIEQDIAIEQVGDLVATMSVCTSTDECFGMKSMKNRALDILRNIPAADVVKIPATGIGDLSDGYHTFNGLYYQRMILFAALVKQNKGRAWKSYRHEDGELCFGGGWFIVGIDTPEGSYTYHYESKDFDLFDCEELPAGKHWDGHTEADVTRLLSLPAADVMEVRHGKWIWDENGVDWGLGAWECSECHHKPETWWEVDKGNPYRCAGSKFCPNCGAKMDLDGVVK